jgi:hypothetical protein
MIAECSLILLVILVAMAFLAWTVDFAATVSG